MADTLLRRGLKLSHLRIVAALAETGQIGAAAASLNITQPAASRLLAEAGQIAGHPVHVRAGRGVELTPQGAALAARAARILSDLNDAARDMDEIGAGRAGHVRIGAVTGAALDRILPLLQSDAAPLRGLTAQIEVAPSDALADMLVAGRLDLALARPPEHLERGLFDWRPLGDEPVSLVVGRDHPLLAGAPAPEALMAHDWLLPQPGAILHRTVLSRLAALGLPAPRTRIATSSFLLTLALLRHSDDIAPMATAVASAFAGGDSAFAVLPVDLAIRVETYGLMTLGGAALTPAAARLAALLAER